MQNDHNKLLAFCGRDVSEGKCAGLKSKKPKTVDDDECKTSKEGSKKGDGRKAVNEALSKSVKERWIKKKEIEKKGASSSRGGSRGGATSRGGSRGGATSIGGSKGGATSRGGSRGSATNRGGSRGGANKRGRGSNSIPFQGLSDKASDEVM
ncbi:hypothetical protein Tco_0062786 [Tanacetum coccineum]